MKSKKTPAKLSFQHYDAKFLPLNQPVNNICFMYKSGDDLRQDNLVLNMIKVSVLRPETGQPCPQHD